MFAARQGEDGSSSHIRRQLNSLAQMQALRERTLQHRHSSSGGPLTPEPSFPGGLHNNYSRDGGPGQDPAPFYHRYPSQNPSQDPPGEPSSDPSNYSTPFQNSNGHPLSLGSHSGQSSHGSFPAWQYASQTPHNHDGHGGYPSQPLPLSYGSGGIQGAEGGSGQFWQQDPGLHEHGHSFHGQEEGLPQPAADPLGEQPPDA